MKENILNTLCLSCMRDAGEKFETCPFCGAAAKVENQFHQLAPGSVLNGRFVVGKTLGQGGFGITYAGYDLTADTKVAIKEFYPDGGVSRQKDLYTILPYSEKKTEELFTDGRAKFLKEAQKLAKFTDTEGIVQVRDYFEENGTAYIVMECISCLPRFSTRWRRFTRREFFIATSAPIISLFRPPRQSCWTSGQREISRFSAKRATRSISKRATPPRSST